MHALFRDIMMPEGFDARADLGKHGGLKKLYVFSESSCHGELIKSFSDGLGH